MYEAFNFTSWTFFSFYIPCGGCFCWGIIYANGVSKLLMMVRTMWYQFTQVKLSIEYGIYMFELFDNNIQFLYADNQWFSFVVY